MRRWHRRLATIVLSLIGAPISACSSGPDTAAGGAGGGGRGGSGGSDAGVPNARWPACDPAATKQTITFVHFNDMHGHYNVEPGLGVSRAAIIRGYYESVKAENPFTIFSNAGDDYEKGSVVEPLSNYVSTREVEKALDVDVRVIGNHDFAFSPEEVLAYSRSDKLVLASNIDYTGDPAEFGAVKYGELSVGCIKIGFMGAVSAPWDEENTQYQGDFYPQFPTNLDFVDVHRKLITAHRSEVDLLVSVSHLGVGDDALVAEQAPGLDVILGGHSHTPLFAPEVSGETLIIQSGAYSGFVGRLDLTIDLATRKVTDSQYKLLPTTLDLGVSDATEKAVEAILAKYGPHAFDAIGRTKSSVPELRAAELACQGAMLALGVDAAIIDVGAAFAGISQGQVSQQSVFSAFLIERQPPGTPGWTSTWTADIDGVSLAALSSLDPTQWASILPASIDPAKTYKIALPRYAAVHPDKHLPSGATVSGATFAKETWELLDALARDRTQQCKYLDADDALPGCSP